MPKIEKDLIVANKKGLHARPAAAFVQLLDKMEASVTVQKGSDKINGKSIMGLLTLGAQCGTVLKITVDGDTASQAMSKIETFLAQQEEEYINE